jgi:hypothetical protein
MSSSSRLFSNSRFFAAVLGALVLAGGGGVSLAGEPATPRESDKIRIEKPEARARIASRSSFEIKGTIETASGEKVPNLIVVQILKKEKQPIQMGAWSISLGKDEAETVFKKEGEHLVFRKQTVAPSQPGRYTVIVTKVTTILDTAGKSTQKREPSRPAEFEIRK